MNEEITQDKLLEQLLEGNQIPLSEKDKYAIEEEVTKVNDEWEMVTASLVRKDDTKQE